MPAKKKNRTVLRTLAMLALVQFGVIPIWAADDKAAEAPTIQPAAETPAIDNSSKDKGKKTDPHADIFRSEDREKQSTSDSQPIPSSEKPVQPRIAKPQSSPQQFNRGDIQMESKDVRLVESIKGLSALSKKKGISSQIVVGLPKGGGTRLDHTTLGDAFAYVVLDDLLLGYNGHTCRWSTKTIANLANQPIIATLAPTTMTVKIGDETYVLNQQTNEWTSLKDLSMVIDPPIVVSAELPGPPQLPSMPVAALELKLRGAISSPESQRLSAEIDSSELEAVKLADEIRTLNADTAGTDEASKTKRTELRAQLEKSLSKTFDMKSQLEQLRVRELKSRIERFERQLDQRQQQRAEIIERRKTELLEGDETLWNTELLGNAKPTEERPPVTIARRRGMGPIPDNSGRNTEDTQDKGNPTPRPATGPQDRVAERNMQLVNLGNISNGEIIVAIGDAQAALQKAEGELKYTSKLFTDKVVSADEKEIAERKVAAAQIKLELLKEQYQAELKDLELQLELVKAEWEAAQRMNPIRNGTEDGMSKRATMELNLRDKQAELSVKRLEVRFHRFRKAGESLNLITNPPASTKPVEEMRELR